MNANNQPQTAPNAPAAVSPVPLAPARRPLWRGCLTLGVTMVILVLAFAVVLWLLRGTHAKPLDVKSYPFARTVSEKQLGYNADQSVYLTGDPIEKVISFYIGQYGKAASDFDNGCMPIAVPAPKAGTPPIQIVRCITDSSFLDITQTATLKIQPSTDGSAQVMIIVTRNW